MVESALLSCEWVQQNYNTEKLVILDATFFLPRQHRNAQEEYQQQHLSGALFFDIDKIADLSSSLSHMLPKAECFADAVGKMGIGNDTRVLIYDNNHFFAAARAWWMFRVFGHDLVRVVDGGMVRWKQLNFPTNSRQPNPIAKNFKAEYRPELVFDLKQMELAQRSNSRQIIDARSAGSFLGQGRTADTALQQGNIPGSINIPYVGLTDREQSLFTNQILQALFHAAHVDLSKPIVTTCGSGVSACVLALALYQLGLKDIPVYDGSWAEWGRQMDTPNCS
jgi:thiosulfate/3-mercaptopyruvate sulfurtransferase